MTTFQLTLLQIIVLPVLLYIAYGLGFSNGYRFIKKGGAK
jgi:hypothetical protein